jgi:hypothetical protein
VDRSRLKIRFFLVTAYIRDLTKDEIEKGQKKTLTRSKILHAHPVRKIRIFLTRCRTFVLQAFLAFQVLPNTEQRKNRSTSIGAFGHFLSFIRLEKFENF